MLLTPSSTMLVVAVDKPRPQPRSRGATQWTGAPCLLPLQQDRDTCRSRPPVTLPGSEPEAIRQAISGAHASHPADLPAHIDDVTRRQPSLHHITRMWTLTTRSPASASSCSRVTRMARRASTPRLAPPRAVASTISLGPQKVRTRLASDRRTRESTRGTHARQRDGGNSEMSLRKISQYVGRSPASLPMYLSAPAGAAFAGGTNGGSDRVSGG